MKILTSTLVAAVLMWCAGPEPGKSDNETSSLTPPITQEQQVEDARDIFTDSIPFRFLSFSEQVKRSEPFHQYGDLKLKRIQPMSYEHSDEEKGIVIREYYPGVLLWYSTKNPYSQPRKIEFYDTEKKLVSSLDVKVKSPYPPDKYNVIAYGYPNREAISDPEDPDFDCKFDDLPKPEGYIVLNDAHVSPSGYVVTEHQLVGVKDQVIVSWEETLVVYDPRGKAVSSITLPYDTRYPFVSSNGQFLALISGSSDNPFDRCFSRFQIYDLKLNNWVYKQQSKSGEDYTWPVETERTDFLCLGYEIIGRYVTREFYDLKSRVRYSKTFTPDEWLVATADFTTYAEMMKKYTFNYEKF